MAQKVLSKKRLIKKTEEVVEKICRNALTLTGTKNLCLAGGVALNCVANGILLREKIFDNIWIQPAAGDAGGALGAALSTWHLHHNKDRKVSKLRDAMKGAYLGPEFSDIEIEAKEILRIKDMLNRSMAEMTGQTFEKIEKDTDRDYFLSASEAKEYGLIDRVISHPNED